MDWRTFLIFVLIFETVLFILLITSLFILRKYENYKQKTQVNNEREISKVILDCLQGKKVDWKKDLAKYRGTLALIKVLEAYYHRFSGKECRNLLEKIANKFLLSKARKNWNNKSWIKRDQAVRSFVLSPQLDDEKKLLTLLKDPVFLVRSNAAQTLLILGSKKGLEEIIKTMSSERGYASDFYQDLLHQYETPEISKWIQEMGQENNGKAFHIATLGLMARKIQTLTYPDLLKDLVSDDPDIRFAAICVFTRNPQKSSRVVIFDCMKDPDERVRIEAFKGASHYLTKISLELLEKGLSDQAFEVRKAAAFSLKKMGRPGNEILERQSFENKDAYETAQYAMQFDE